MKLLMTAGTILALAGYLPAQQIRLPGEGDAVNLSSRSASPVIIPPLPELGAAAAAPETVALKVEVAKSSSAAKAEKNPVESQSQVTGHKSQETVTAAEKAPAAMAGGGFAVVKKHAVVRGETLWGLAGRYYGDSFKWGRIYNANMDKIEDPDRIYPEEEIKIPDITEVVKPAPAPETAAAAEVSGGEEAGAPAAEKTAAASEEIPVPLPLPAEKADSAGKVLVPSDGEDKVPDLELSDFSNEMPEDQKEWRAGAAVVVPENWKEDGVLVSRVGAGEEEEADGLTAPGDRVRIKVRDSSGFRPGEIISAYMKGAVVYDKRTNKKLGRELQKTGSLEVVSVGDNIVVARVIKADTSVDSGQVIKK